MPESVSSPGRRTTCKGERPLVQNGRKRLDHPHSRIRHDRRRRPRALRARAGRARHRRRPGARRPALPRGRAGLGALQRRQARARATSRPTWTRCRPTRTARTTALGVVRGQVQDSIVRQYEGQSLAAVGQVVVSDDPQAFLVPALDHVGVQRPAVASSSTSTPPSSRSLDIRSDATEKRAADVAETEKKLRRREGRPSTTSSPRPRTCSPTSRRRSARTSLSRGIIRTPSDVPASGRAAAAVAYAMAQVGDAYVYGAAGPSAFDCSGLTMMAWAQAGVGLPHSSSAQYGSGPHVACERPAARRPGLLLQPDQPRRHVHRQRHDRARRQPRHRRRRLRPVLHAVRRRGPARLRSAPAAERRPVAHAGGWPAFRCACWSPPGCWPGRWSTTSRTSRRRRPGRRDAALAPAARGRRAGGLRAGRPHRRRGRRARPRAGRRRRGGGPARRDRGERRGRRRPRLHAALRRRPRAPTPTALDARRRHLALPRASTRPPRTPRCASGSPTTATGSRSPGSAAATGCPRCGCPGRWRCAAPTATLVLVDGSSAEADSVARRAEAAVPVVQRVLPQWRRGLVVEVPALGRRARRRARRRPRQLRPDRRGHHVGGRLARSRRRRSTCSSTPTSSGACGATGAQVVMSHEATHVATERLGQHDAAVAARGLRRLRRAARRRPAAVPLGGPGHRRGPPQRAAAGAPGRRGVRHPYAATSGRRTRAPGWPAGCSPRRAGRPRWCASTATSTPAPRCRRRCARRSGSPCPSSPSSGGTCCQTWPE